MPTHHHTTAAGHAHTIESRRTSAIGLQPNAVPPNRALELTSDSTRPGYRIAHRQLAKALGWTTKAFEMHVYDGRPGAVRVKTYWLPPIDVRTDTLSDEPQENK